MEVGPVRFTMPDVGCSRECINDTEAVEWTVEAALALAGRACQLEPANNVPAKIEAATAAMRAARIEARPGRRDGHQRNPGVERQ